MILDDPRPRMIALVAATPLLMALSGPTISVENIVTNGALVVPSQETITATSTVIVEEGTALRFFVTAQPAGPPQFVSSVDFTVSQAGKTLVAYGPPGVPNDPKSRSRSVPVCTAKVWITCSVLPDATVTQASGPVTLIAHATNSSGTTTVSVTYVAVDKSNHGSSDPGNLSPAPAICGNVGQIGLTPSYEFNNESRKLTSASFYFSASYLGPNPDDPPCSSPPNGVSGVTADTLTVFGGDTSVPRSPNYLGNIPKVGRWSLTAYSPEVGIIVTCVKSFGNDGTMFGNVVMVADAVDNPHGCN